MKCVNIDQNFLDWIKKYGPKFTVEQYVKHGDFLPKLSDFENIDFSNLSGEQLQEEVNKLLPEGVFSIDNINNIVAELPKEAKAAFFENVLYFGEKATKKEVAEESFHAIFQTLIKGDRKQELLNIGKQILINKLNKTVKEHIQELRDLYPATYAQMSNREAMDRVYEETLANEFVNWYSYNPVTSLEQQVVDFPIKWLSPSAKNLIVRFFNWIRSLFNNSLKDRTKLELFFKDIRDGKFRKSNIVNENSDKFPTTRLIQFEDEDGNTITLSSGETQEVIRNVAQVYLKLKDSIEGEDIKVKKGEVLDIVMKGILDSISNISLANWQKLTPLFEKETYNSFTEESEPNTSYVNLKNDVAKYLNDQFKEDLGEQDDEESQMQLWSDATSANEKSMEDSMSKWLKAYIGTTGDLVYDEFNNPVFINIDLGGISKQIPLIQVVDTNRVYYGLARALSNSQHEISRLKKLKDFANIEGNSASSSFFNKIMEDVLENPSVEAKELFKESIDNIYQQIKSNGFKNIGLINKLEGLREDKKYILQSVLKGFDFWVRDNWVNTLDGKDGKLLSKVFSANSNSVINNQIGQFKDGLSTYIEQSNKAKGNDIAALSKSDYATLFNQYNAFERLKKIYHLQLSNYTLKYILAQRQDASESKTDEETIAKKEAIEKFFPEYYTFKEYIGDYNTAPIISLFTKTFPQFNAEQLNKWDISGDVKDLAEINAYFDEGLTESSYKNAENKNIYTYQYKTQHLAYLNFFMHNTDWWEDKVRGAVHEYADGKYLDSNIPFVQNNYYVKKFQDNNWKKFLTKLKHISIDGLNFNDDANTFGGMTNKDFNILRLNLAFREKQRKENGITVRPLLIGVLESKRTADFIEITDVKNKITKITQNEYGIDEEVVETQDLFNEGIMTNATQDLIKDEIEKEYNRIRQQSAKISEALISLYEIYGEDIISKDDKGNKSIKISNALISKDAEIKSKFGDVFEGFHTGVVIPKFEGSSLVGFTVTKGSPRALEFSDVLKGFVENKEFQNIREQALADVNFSRDIKSIVSQYEELYQAHLTELRNQGILVGENLPYTPNVKYAELKEYFLSSLLNTIYINQLIHGDNALLYKNDGVDMNKRFGGRNAAIVSMKTGFTNSALGVHEAIEDVRVVIGNEIVQKSGVDNGNIDAADAQTWQSVNMKRKFLHSQNKLSKATADILTKIEYGVPISRTELNYLKENDIYFNVDKPVGFDGYIYVKTGAVMLTKDMTSVFTGKLVDVDGNRISINELPEKIEDYTDEQISTLLNEDNWKAIKGSEFLHEVRKAMYKHKFDLYAPKSASKMLTANLYNADYSTGNITDSIKNSIMKIDADFYGLQMENPAGKLRIFDPSQNQEIVVNELNKLSVFKNGDKKLEIDLLQEYQNYLSQRDDVAFLQATKELYNEDGFRWKNFLSKAQDTLASSGADVQTLTFYTPDANGNRIYNPNLSITLEKFVNLFFSHFSKGVLQQKVAGDALAHISSFGFKPLKKVVKYKYKGVDVYSWEVVSRNSRKFREQIDNAKTLSFSDKEANFIYDETDDFSQLDFTTGDTALIRELKALGEGTYFIDDLRHNKPKWNVNSEGIIDENTPYLGTFTEAILPTWNSKIKITNDSKWMQGVRIPSQDKHSAVNIEWIDTLPEYYGNTIIVAKEIVQLSGSDFDIDKLFLNKPELKEDGTKYQNTWEDYLEFQIKENKSLKKLLKAYNKEEEISDEEFLVATMFGEKEAKYKYLLPRALKELQLPSTKEEYKNAFTQNIGALNNEILNIRQLALTNDETLKAKYFNPEGEQITKEEFKNEEGYYKINAIYKTPATQDELKETLAKDEDFKNLEIFNKNFNYSIHSWLAQSLSHRNTTTGKRNISVAVNANLLGIVLKRLGINFLSPTIIKYGDKEVGNSTVENYVYGGKRLFDMISTLVSAATDEAKDQQNAKYNLTIPRLNIMIPLLLQGHDMKTAIALVNHPSLKNYFDILSTKDNKAQNETEQKRKYEKDIDILITLFKILPASTKEFTQEALINDLKNNTQEIGSHVVFTAINTLKTMEEINPLMDFIKLKRGIGKSTADWEKLLESYNKLFPENLPQEPFTDIHTKIAYFDGQLANYTKILFKDEETALEEKMQNLFVHYKKETKLFNSLVKSELKASSSVRFNEVVDNELMSYLYSKLYYNYLETVNPDKIKIYQEVYDNTKIVVNKIRALLKYVENNKGKGEVEVFEKNTFLNKIKFGVNSATRVLEIPTFSKMSGKDQTSLIDGFESLFRSTLNLNITETIDGEQVTVDGNLADELFAYFVVKDGWLFRKGSLSKAISPFFFKEHSASLENYLQKNYFNEEQMNQMVIDATIAFALNEKNMKYIPQVKDSIVTNYKGDSYNVVNISNKAIKIDLEQATKLLTKMNEGKEEGKSTAFDLFADNLLLPYLRIEEGKTKFEAPLFLVHDKKLFKLDEVSLLEEDAKGFFNYNTYNDIENIHEYRQKTLRKASYIPIKFVSLGDRKTLTTSPNKMQLNLFEPKITSLPIIERGVSSEYTSYSGDAKGSDKYWAEVGREYGIGKQVDYTVDTLKKLTSQQLEEVEQAYQSAVKKLNRKPLDKNTYSGGLVRRDYLQAKAGDAVFAVSSFENGNYKQMKVNGGTAYAVQMALDLGKSVYFFDQILNKWYLMNLSLSSKPIELSETPVLTKKFTGVGTRELNENGKKAIRDVYKNTFKQPLPKEIDDAFYSQLPNKTKSGNVIIKTVYQKEGVDYAKSIGGIFSMRVDNTDKHFGNPYSSDLTLVKKDGLIKTSSTKESVEKYIDWVLNAKTNFYTGKIIPEPDTVFVFGSNPVGINGNPSKNTGGSALIAYKEFGVKQGEKMNNKLSESGQAYGLTTVSYPGNKLSLSPNEIAENIKILYKHAKQNPDKKYKIAYTNTIEKSLNGYSGLEMIEMFNLAGETPNNIIFSEEWKNTGKLLNSRAEWIREQLKSNLLKNKPIIYYKELGEPSHANALDYLINKYKWNTQTNEVEDDDFIGVISEDEIDEDFDPFEGINPTNDDFGDDNFDIDCIR